MKLQNKMDIKMRKHVILITICLVGYICNKGIPH